MKIAILRFVGVGMVLGVFPSTGQTTEHTNRTTATSGETGMTIDYTQQGEDFWKKHLRGETLQVCRYQGTERPGSGQYDHFWEDGIYYCACCGGDHALYRSEDKFDSGTGWPSFYKPIEGGILERPDPKDEKAFFGLRGLVLDQRTEVLCARCHSHLGHVFNDVDPSQGRRYCMNSAALVFVKKGETPQRTFSVTED